MKKTAKTNSAEMPVAEIIFDTSRLPMVGKLLESLESQTRTINKQAKIIQEQAILINQLLAGAEPEATHSCQLPDVSTLSFDSCNEPIF